MAAALKTLFDKQKLALARARFRAWWEGAPFDEEAATAEIAAAANDSSPELDDELFDAPPFEPPPRLVALSLLWGEGRIRPGDPTAEAQQPAQIGVPADGVLAILGPGHIAPLAAIAAAHSGPIEVFEWREETFEALQHEIAKAKLGERITATRIDLEAHVFTPNHFDGLLSTDDFAYCSYPPHLAQQLFKTLKPGASAMVECYIGMRIAELSTAFATAFSEPHIRAHGDLLQFFRDTGLRVEADEDLTESFLAQAKQGFTQLGGRLSDAGDLGVAAAQELAWEAEAWRMRLRLLAQRRLERRRFVLRRPREDEPLQEDAAENANAPTA